MVSVGPDKYRFQVFFCLFSCHICRNYSYFLQFGTFDRVLKDELLPGFVNEASQELGLPPSETKWAAWALLRIMHQTRKEMSPTPIALCSTQAFRNKWPLWPRGHLESSLGSSSQSPSRHDSLCPHQRRKQRRTYCFRVWTRSICAWNIQLVSSLGLFL